MIKALNLVAAVVAAFLLSATAFAAEKADVCVKFRKDNGWSKGYSVQGIVISGSDLNSKVGSFTRFKSFSTYVVVFWDQEQASILELPALSMGTVPMFETEVEDQQGKKWKVREGHSMCY